jgi:lipoyl(octanoyl) transferase
VSYPEALAMQRALVEERRADRVRRPAAPAAASGGDHARRQGRRRRSNVVATPERLAELGIAVEETGRGGDVTYHGPGQIVGYPIVDLRPTAGRAPLRARSRRGDDPRLRRLRLEAGRIKGLTGAGSDRQCGAEKIGAIGVRISRWITSHGFAFNVSTRLDHFQLIVPCGIADRGVTSLEKATGRSIVDRGSGRPDRAPLRGGVRAGDQPGV